MAVPPSPRALSRDAVRDAAMGTPGDGEDLLLDVSSLSSLASADADEG